MSAPCLVCQHRIPDYPQVCTSCRSRMASDLAELVAAWRGLSAEPGRRNTERVTGTREKPLGVNVAALDLMVPARHVQAVHDAHSDQCGAVPVAVVLGSWARHWAEMRGERLPASGVERLADWLTVRLGWAADRHPAVDEYVREIRAALATCRAVMGDRPQRPEPCEGIACPKCDLRALYRAPGSDLVHCGTCPHLMTQKEYLEVAKEQANRLMAVACRPSMIVSD